MLLDLSKPIETLEGKPYKEGSIEFTQGMMLARILSSRVSDVDAGEDPVEGMKYSKKLWAESKIELEKTEVRKLMDFTRKAGIADLFKGQIVESIETQLK